MFNILAYRFRSSGPRAVTSLYENPPASIDPERLEALVSQAAVMEEVDKIKACFAAEVDMWVNVARKARDDGQTYRSALQRIAIAIGEEARRMPDGTLSDDIVPERVAELVETAIRRKKTFRESVRKLFVKD